MLFEHDRGEERRLEAVRATVADDAAKAAKGGAAARFVVVRQAVEEPLDRQRRAQARDEPSLAPSKKGVGTPDPFFTGQRT